MKHSFRIVLIALAVLLIFVSVPKPGLADAGNFSGDSDWGGGGSDWGGSSDWGSDSDWGDSSGGILIFNGDGSFSFGGLIVLVFLVIFVFRALNKQKKRKGVPQGGAPTADPQMPISELKRRDPGFSEEAFCERVSNLYVQMQNAWQDKKWETMRPHMTDALYNQFARQLDVLIRDHKTNRIEKICVMSATISGYTCDEVNDIIPVRLRTRILDYVVDDVTGNVVSGKPNTELFMEYEWTLIRRRGVLTEEKEGMKTVKCPSCGAPVELNFSAKCEYCGTILESSQYDWVISAIRGISQRTGA